MGAAATQAYGGADLGPLLLDLLRRGMTATEALEVGLEEVNNVEFRQAGVVDAMGNVAAHTGEKCTPAAGHLAGEGFSVQANIMLDNSVWPAMKKAFELARGDLADRLVAALESGQAAGGDLRGQLSAAMLIVSGEKQKRIGMGRLLELRVEEHPRPIKELKRLVKHYRAHQLLRQARILGMNGRFAEVTEAMNRALELIPDQIEFKFYLATGLFGSGQTKKALDIFKEVFSQDTRWAELVPRLVSRRMVPDDPELIKLIMDQRPEW